MKQIHTCDRTRYQITAWISCLRDVNTCQLNVTPLITALFKRFDDINREHLEHLRPLPTLGSSVSVDMSWIRTRSTFSCPTVKFLALLLRFLKASGVLSPRLSPGADSIMSYCPAKSGPDRTQTLTFRYTWLEQNRAQRCQPEHVTLELRSSVPRHPSV